MAEYIEREKAYSLAKKIVDAIASGNCPSGVFGHDILDWIDDIPAADVRPVVLCRDCKHEGLLSCPMVVIEKQQMVFINHDPEFFCASGERKK